MKTLLLTALLLFTFHTFSQEEESTADTCRLDIPWVFEPTEEAPFFVTGSNCEIDTFSIMVFNRWGEIQFESTDIKKHWNAIDTEQGVYVWKIFIRFISGKEWEGTGHFSILI